MSLAKLPPDRAAPSRARSAGASCTNLGGTPVTAADLGAVSCPTSVACFAAGAGGALVATTDGSSWAAQRSGTTNVLSAIACSSSTTCVAVGAGGTIVATSDGGSSWSAQVSGTSAALSGVACPVAGTCFAVGAGGAIVVTSNGGSSWAARSSGTTNVLSAVACPGATTCFAVGSGGTIVATSNGSNWTAQPSGTTSPLLAVAFPNGFYQGFATGAGGLIDADTCSGGTLGLTPPSAMSFAPVSLTGVDQTTTAAATLTADDETGSLAGWSVSAYATPFTDGQGHTIPSPRVTAGAATPVTGTCTLPANAVSYPTSAIGTSSGTATKVFSAATGTGAGRADLNLGFSMAVPANQLITSPGADAFSSTVTFTVSSGP